MTSNRKVHEMTVKNEKPIRPQNKSRPAGGASAANDNRLPATGDSKRGVIVAPPSGNTSPPELPIVLHRGFDTLAVAIKANVSDDLFEQLDAEQKVASDERREIVVILEGITFLLSPHGGAGYRFILKGGQDGATWFIKKPNAKDKWGIRLSFGSFFMAMHGLGAAKAHADHVTAKLGIRFGPDDVSISRADFCVDVLSPDFVLNPDQFVMHSKMDRRDHISADDMAVHGKSGRVTSVTIGKPRNRQVIIYDKRAEVIAHNKSYWWSIWNHTLRTYVERGNSPTALSNVKRDIELSPDAAHVHANRVWRVEFRAGKDLLKDRWGIRTWEQFFDRFGDLCREAGEVVRYIEPDATDPNRARWPNHPIWDIVCAEMNDDLTEMRSGADPNPMKEVHREEHIAMLFRNLLGSSITLGALRGVDPDGLGEVFNDLAANMNAEVTADPVRTAKQLQDAKDRYVFIKPRKPPK